MRRFDEIYVEHMDTVRAYVRRRAPESLVVEFVDANGNILDSAPVTNNLFVSDKRFEQGQAAFLLTLDAAGNVLSKEALP